MTLRVALVTLPMTYPVRRDCVNPEMLARIDAGQFADADASDLSRGIDYIKNRTGVPRYTMNYGVLSLVAYIREHLQGIAEIHVVDGFGPAVLGFQRVRAYPIHSYQNDELLVRHGLPVSEIAAVVAEREPHVVGLNCFASAFHNDLIDTADAIRRELPSALIVAGGLHPTALDKYLVSRTSIDVVVRGEGEETLADLLCTVAASRPLDRVDGITFWRDGRPVETGSRRFLALSDMPWIARDVVYRLADERRAVDVYGMWDAAHQGGSVDVLQRTRGCVASADQCRNCVSGHAAGPLRERSPEDVAAEAAMLADAGITHVAEQSDQVLIPKKSFLGFCRLVAERGIGNAIHFTTGNGLWLNALAEMDEGDLDLMLRAGFRDLTVDIGGSPGYVAKVFNRCIDGKSVDNVFSRLRAAERRTGLTGIHRAFLIVSGAGSTREMNAETVSLAERLSRSGLVDAFDPFIATPLPGSAYFRDVLALLSANPEGAQLFEGAAGNWEPACNAIDFWDQLEQLRLWPRLRFGRANFEPLYGLDYAGVYSWIDQVYYLSHPRFLSRRIG